MLRDIPKRLQVQLGIGPIEEATFIQKDVPLGRHRDTIRFRNNQETLLQNLVEGQPVVVRDLLPDASSEIQAPDSIEALTFR